MSKWEAFNDDFAAECEPGRRPAPSSVAAFRSFLEMEECLRVFNLVGAPTEDNHELFQTLLDHLMVSLDNYKLEWDVHPLWNEVVLVLFQYDMYQERVLAIALASGVPMPPPPTLDENVLREMMATSTSIA